MATTNSNHAANQANEQAHAIKVLQGNVPAQGSGSGSGPATLPSLGQQWP